MDPYDLTRLRTLMLVQVRDLPSGCVTCGIGVPVSQLFCPSLVTLSWIRLADVTFPSAAGWLVKQEVDRENRGAAP